MSRIGIMQGRLLPPVDGVVQGFPTVGWATEFALAGEAKFDCIEWLYDAPAQHVNPIASNDGIRQIRTLAQQHGVAVESLCAHYFIQRPPFSAGAANKRDCIDKLTWLIGRSALLGIKRIVLPLLEESSIPSLAEGIEFLGAALPVAEREGVELHLETSLDPAAFARLLDKLPSPNAKVTYDCGNSASFGYDFREELANYGYRIGSVHVKDRIRGGGTVPLGQGNADIAGIVEHLNRLDYRGDFVLEVARSMPGRELEEAKHNLALLRSYVRTAAERVPECAQ